MKSHANYSLYLFGWPRLLREDQPVPVETRKALALLAYLATSGERHSRDKLAALFWPDYDQSRARANLRRVLWSVNKAVGEGVLTADQDSVSLPANGRLWVDALQFNQLIVQAETHNGTLYQDDEAIAGLIQAANLYQDEFLAGFSLDDSPKFDEWQRQQARQLGQKMGSALSHLVTAECQRGEFDMAARFAQQWLALDELNEIAHRQLMQIYAWNDNRAGALRQYEDCKIILQNELGVPPEPTTTQLYETIKTGRLRIPVDKANLATVKSVEPIPVPSNPYRGLFAFREEDAPLFFGREAFTHDLITAVHRQPLVALFGASGSGKSSVIRAGLVAGLRLDKKWAISLFRPSSRPFHSLAAALLPCLAPELGEVDQLAESAHLAESFQSGAVSLADVVARIADNRSENGRFLLIADQFEELYTLCPETELRRQFLDLLLTAVYAQPPHQDPRFTFLFGLRADFLGQALNYRPFADAIQHQDIKLSPMNDLELRRAIQQPAQSKNVQFEVGLTGRILTGVGDEPGNLPLLQFALTTLWPRQHNGLITHDAYKQIGKVTGALSVYADEVMASLTAEEQVSARRIFVQLVRPGEGTEDTRRLATREELGSQNWQLVRKLADTRLVVTSRDAVGNDVAEIAHEALIRGWDCLRQWMASDRAFRLWQERIRVSVRQWEATEHDVGALLRGLSLEEAESWLQERQFEISELEKSFIQASVEWREGRAVEQAKLEADRVRLRKRVFTGLIIAFLLMLLLTATAVWQWRQAVARGEDLLAAEQQVAVERTQAQMMLSRQLALHGESLLPDQFLLGSLLSVEAANIGDTVASRRSLLAALNAEPTLNQFVHGHEGAVTAVAYSSDPPFIISGDAAGKLHFWDLATKETAVIDLSESFGAIRDIVVNADQSLLALLSHDGVVQLWDLSRQQPLDFLSTEAFAKVVSLDFGPDAHQLALVTNDRRLIIVDVSTGVLAHEVRLPQGVKPTVVAFNQDGRQLAVGIANGTVQLWDFANTPRNEKTILAHDAAVTDVVFHPDGHLLATADEDGLIQLWSVASGGPVEEPLEGHEGRIYELAFSPNGRYLASGGQDGSIHVWKIGDNQFLDQELHGHAGQVLALAFSADGETLISGSADDSVILWNMTGHPAMVESHHLPGQVVTAVAASANGRYTAAGTANGEVVLRDQLAQNANAYKATPLLDEELLQIEALAFSRDGEWLTAVDQQNLLAQWQLETGKLLQSPISLPGQGWGPVKFSSDGNKLLFILDSDHVGVWDVIENKLLDNIPVQTSVIFNNFSLSENGRYLAVPNCFDIQINPNNQFCLENNIRLWDFDRADWSETVFPGSYSMIVSTAFSPDDERLTAVKQDGSLMVWDVASGELLESQVLVSQTYAIQSIIFSPDGKTLAVSVETGEIIFWDVDTASVLGTLSASEELLSRLPMAFAPDSQSLLTGNTAGEINVWSLQPEVWQQLICNRIQRNLTEAEWIQYLGDIPYRETCFEKN